MAKHNIKNDEVNGRCGSFVDLDEVTEQDEEILGVENINKLKRLRKKHGDKVNLKIYKVKKEE